MSEFRIFDGYVLLLSISVVFRGALETANYIIVAVIWLLLVWIVDHGQHNQVADTNTLLMFRHVLQDLNTLFGQMVSLAFSIGTFMMYYCFFKTKLLPSWLSLWGVLGAILYFSCPILYLYSINLGLLMSPLAIQEIFMGFWRTRGGNCEDSKEIVINN